MASFKTGVLGAALLLTSVVLAPACDDDPKAEEPSGGSGGSGGSTSKGGANSKGGATSNAGTTGEGGYAGAGTAACEELGEICHPADADPMGAECHDIGHTGDGPACLEAYDDCIAFCTDYVAGLGGAGGAAHGHGGESPGGAGGHGGG